MKRETIIDLYYGKLNPMEQEMLEAEEYKAHSDGFVKGAESFAKKLPAELQEEFRKLCEMEMEADEILHRDGFCKGFRLGLRLAAEAYMDGE